MLGPALAAEAAHLVPAKGHAGVHGEIMVHPDRTGRLVILQFGHRKILSPDLLLQGRIARSLCIPVCLEKVVESVDQILRAGVHQTCILPKRLFPSRTRFRVVGRIRAGRKCPGKAQQHNGGECVLVGKVLQVSKRQQVVLFSVEQPSGKPMKITLTNPDERMKAEQIWSVKAFLVDNKLQITEAAPLSPVEEPENDDSPPETTPSSKLILAAPSPPTEKAIGAIALETGVSGWQLMTATPRTYGWEWEAMHPKLGRKARVAINNGQYQVYEYNPNTNIPPITTSPDTDRLVVTPLGAARGIGASCFIPTR